MTTPATAESARTSSTDCVNLTSGYFCLSRSRVAGSTSQTHDSASSSLKLRIRFFPQYPPPMHAILVSPKSVIGSRPQSESFRNQCGGAANKAASLTSPQRHRVHRVNFEFEFRNSIFFQLRVLSASAVQSSNPSLPQRHRVRRGYPKLCTSRLMPFLSTGTLKLMSNPIGHPPSFR